MDPRPDHTHDILPVNELDFDDVVLAAPCPVLVDLVAPWCAPCRAAEPEVLRIAQEFRDDLRVVRIDGAEAPSLVARLGVRGFPTFMMFARGRETARLAGFPGAKRLASWVAEHA